MIRLAVADHPLFEVSDIENRRLEKSYSVPTLRLFRHELGPAAEIYFIVGLDAMLEIETWMDFQEIFKLCHFVVLDRPGYEFLDLAKILKNKMNCSYQTEDKVFNHPDGSKIYFCPIPGWISHQPKYAGRPPWVNLCVSSCRKLSGVIY